MGEDHLNSFMVEATINMSPILMLCYLCVFIEIYSVVMIKQSTSMHPNIHGAYF